MSRNEWPDEPAHNLTELEGFDAMRAFLEAYWELGAKTSDDIAVLLGSLNRGNGPPLDPALWFDWLEAVDRVVKRRAVEMPDGGRRH